MFVVMVSLASEFLSLEVENPDTIDKTFTKEHRYFYDFRLVREVILRKMLRFSKVIRLYFGSVHVSCTDALNNHF